MKSLRTHVLAKCLNLLLCLLIVQQGFGASLAGVNVRDDQDRNFESCLIEFMEWACDTNIDMPDTSDNNADPQESGGEEECQESEAKEDKNMSYMSWLQDAVTEIQLHVSEEKLSSIAFRGIITPPPEKS